MGATQPDIYIYACAIQIHTINVMRCLGRSVVFTRDASQPCLTKQKRRNKDAAIKLSCLCHRRRLFSPPPPKTSPGYARDEIYVRTFVSRDRNWIQHRTYKIHKCTNVVVRVCYWPGFEEEECSSQDPLAVYISIFLGRLFGFVCVSLSRLHSVSLGKTLWGPISDAM